MGQFFNDRYELGPLIGAGGSGHVHRGTDHALGRTVAMKVLGREHADDDDARDRFRDEAVLAASVQHANVVPVLDAAEEDGELCIVMEYVAGPTLGQYLRTTSLDVDAGLDLLHGIAAGLAAAHGAGLVHRDLKPANVLLAHGVPQVTDFGLARAVADGPDPGTAIRGSAGYLAPEQARGEAATARTDVYALGCLAMHVLTGSPPFDGATPLAVVGQHLHATPPDVRARRPEVPAAVAAAVAAALAKDPADRPPSVAAFAEAIGRPLPTAAAWSLPAHDEHDEPVSIGDLPTDLGLDEVAASAGSATGGHRATATGARERASFGTGAHAGAEDRDTAGVVARARRRWLVPTVAATVLAVLALAGLSLRPSTGIADTDPGLPAASDTIRVTAELRSQVVAVGAGDGVPDARVVAVLDGLAALDEGAVRDDGTAGATAREVRDLVVELVADGLVDDEVGDGLVALADDLVDATTAARATGTGPDDAAG